MTVDDLNLLALEYGIDELAAVKAGPAPVNRQAFLAAVASAPPDLGYLARTLEKRLNPDLVLPGVRTILVGLVSYSAGPPRPSPLPAGTGWISRYAMGQDYHIVAGDRFAALADAIDTRFDARSRWYVDTGPVAEKAWAVAAGLGFQGKNTLLVSPIHGTYVFLGVVLTDIEFTDAPRPAVPDACGNCRRCVDACPTGALDGAGRLDRARCLAHLTVSSKQPLPADIDLAGNLYGCDICQDACPYNLAHQGSQIGPATRRPFPFSPMPGMFCPSLDDILNMDEDAFARVFKASPVFRRGREAVQNTARRLLQLSANVPRD